MDNNKNDKLAKIDKLIKDGEEIKSRNIKDSEIGGQYIPGEEYEMWIIDCSEFLDKYYQNSSFTSDFKSVGRNAFRTSLSYYDKMAAILKYVKKEIENEALKEDEIDPEDPLVYY